MAYYDRYRGSRRARRNRIKIILLILLLLVVVGIAVLFFLQDAAVFTADGFQGELAECDEGELEWVSREFLGSLPMWEGDRIFLNLLWQDAPFFLLTLRYRKDRLLEAILNGNKLTLPPQER